MVNARGSEAFSMNNAELSNNTIKHGKIDTKRTKMCSNVWGHPDNKVIQK